MRLGKRFRRVLVAIFTVFLIGSVPYGYIEYMVLSSNQLSVTIPREPALAAYSAQIQVLAVFASLPPFLFVIREKLKPAAKKPAIKQMALFASTLIFGSTLGIAANLLGIVSQSYSIFAVAFPFSFVILDASGLLWYILGIAGTLDRLLSWANWSLE